MNRVRSDLVRRFTKDIVLGQEASGGHPCDPSLFIEGGRRNLVSERHKLDHYIPSIRK